jgi:hypothetical protein
MSGYLQRMAANAARPERSLHPFVSQLFTGSQREEPVEVSTISEVRPAVRARLNEVPVSEAGKRELHTSGPAATQPGRIVEVAAEGMRADAVMIAPQRLRDAAHEPRERLVEPERLHLLVSHGIEIDDVASDPATSEAATVNRLMERRQAAPIVAPRRENEAAVLERPSLREVDDIQIHIGRIEVIAMPPAAPRTPVAAAPKTTSLDDYLKSRNGRAR